MNIIRIKLKLKSGLLSDLQSDTVFGSFCWRMKEILGEDKLVQFLDLYKNNLPVFSVSNGFLSDKDNIFFPNLIIPYDYVPSDRLKKEKVYDFLDYKAKKKIRFLNIDNINSVLNNKKIELTDIDIPKFEEDLRVSVEIDRDTFSATKGKLFSYAPKHLKENYFLNVFVKIIDENNYKEFKCEHILKETFSIGFGKKKSSGYGEMEVVGDFENFNKFSEPVDSNAYVVLSNYLPSVNDKIDDMFYDFHVKYSKLGESFSKSANPFKKPIIFFKPGSVFKSSVNKDFYGRVTKDGEIINQKGIIQNGIAFTLRMKI